MTEAICAPAAASIATISCRKPFKYKLTPSPEQEERLDWTLWRCRELYNAALAERKEAWRLRHLSIGYYEQKRNLPAIKELRPEYTNIHAHVLQDVLKRRIERFKPSSDE